MITRFWMTFTTERRGLLGAAVLRVGLSAILLGILLVNFKSRYLLWGGGGLVRLTTYDSGTRTPFDLYRYDGHFWYTEFLYFLGIGVAIAFGLGAWPRILSLLFAILSFAILRRSPLAFDAGGNLLHLLAIYLCLMDSGRYFTVFSRKSKRPSSDGYRLLTMLHNAGKFLVAFQICSVSFWAGALKLSGPLWRNGMALHYILQLDRYKIFPALSSALGNDALLTAMTFSIVAFQTVFPLLMWSRRVKPWLVFTAVCLHMGIAVSMGLISFSATIIFADLSLLSNSDWLRLRSFLIRPFAIFVRSRMSNVVKHR